MLEFLEASYAGKILATLLTSMVPIVELRGGIPFGAGAGTSAGGGHGRGDHRKYDPGALHHSFHQKDLSVDASV